MPPGENAASKPYQNLESQQLDELAGFSTCLGYQKVAVTSLLAVKLPSIPKNTRYAMLVVMADATVTDPVNASNVIYFREDGNVPTAGVSPAGDGLPLGDLGIYEVKGIRNLKNFRMIAIRAAETHSVRIQYFG